MFVLVEDIKVYLFYLLDLHLGKFCERLVGEKKFNLVAFRKQLRAVAFFPVERDILLPHHLVDEAFWRLV